MGWKEPRMTLRIGNRQVASGFTLIEVLAAVMILSIGIIGVIRAYVTLMSGIEASRFTVEASYLLKEKAAEVEEEAIENFGIPLANKNGSFSGEYAMYRWETEASEVKIESARPKEEPKGEVKENTKEEPQETLSKVRISVMNGEHGSSKKLSLNTYLENYSE